MGTRSEHRFESTLVETLLDYLDDVADVRTFQDDGVMSGNAGVVVSLADGREYQLTIVQSRVGEDEPDEDGE